MHLASWDGHRKQFFGRPGGVPPPFLRCIRGSIRAAEKAKFARGYQTPSHPYQKETDLLAGSASMLHDLVSVARQPGWPANCLAQWIDGHTPKGCTVPMRPIPAMQQSACEYSGVRSGTWWAASATSGKPENFKALVCRMYPEKARGCSKNEQPLQGFGANKLVLAGEFRLIGPRWRRRRSKRSYLQFFAP